MSTIVVESRAPVVESGVPVEESEAYRVLVGRAFKKTGKVPAEILVRHVLGCVPAEEWPLRIEARPADGQLLGLYATRRPGSGARPYRTLLQGVDPIRGRCDCPDYLRNSLGLCKHILTVLEHIHARPRVLRQALKEQEWVDPPAQEGLWWDPIRPLTGLGDWL